MADPIDPSIEAQQAARGLRGLVGSAGTAIGNAAGSLRDGAMNMLGRAAASPVTGQVVKAATNAPGVVADAASSAAQGMRNALPTIDPSLIDKARGVASDATSAIGDKVSSLRGGNTFTPTPPVAPPTDIYGSPMPGTVPRSGVGGGFGDGFTYGAANGATVTPTSVPQAPANPAFNGGMSAERAAYNAEQAMRMGPSAARATGPLPSSALESASEFLKPVNDAARAGLRAAAPVLEPIANVAGKVAPYALPATTAMSAASSYGQDYDKRLGVDSGTLGADLAHRGLGVMGDLGNTLTFGLADRLGNALAGGGFGHSDFGSNQQTAAAPAAQTPSTPAKDIVSEHYGTPDDITEFNQRMQDVGAPTISMRAGSNDSRVIGNTAPASKEMQDYTDQHMADRTTQLAAADKGYADAAARQHAQAMIMQDPDVMKLTDELQQAQRSGSPAAIQAIATARDNMIRTKSGDRQADTQANVAMRGQDTQDRENVRTTSATIMNGMRQAAIAQRQYGLEARKVGDEESKTAQAERETAQKGVAEQLGKMFTTTDEKGNAVPDAARVGDALQKLHDEVGARIAQAQAVPKDSPHYERAQQIAQALSTKGVAALDDQDKQTLMSQLAIRDRVKQTHSMMPGGSTFVDSDLGGYSAAGVDHNLLGSDTVSLRNGGSIRKNNLRYTEPANAFLPDFKQRTTQFDAGLGMRKQ